MAHFRGRLKGNRGEASRLGTKRSGLFTEAASWNGRIVVDIWHDFETGEDKFLVRQEPHFAKGIHESLVSGVIGKPAK